MTRSYSVGLEALVASGYRRKLPSACTGARLTTTWRVPSALRDCALTWMAGRPAALLIPGRLVSVSCPWIPPTSDRSKALACDLKRMAVGVVAAAEVTSARSRVASKPIAYDLVV